MIKTKLQPAQKWPTSKAPALPPCKYSKTSVKEVMAMESKGGKDSRPWNSTKVAAYDKQC